MLVAHGAVEPPLRDLVAGRREMDRAKGLVGIVLRDGGRGASKTGQARDGQGEERFPHVVLPA
jgi:hypothetical protein